MQNSFHLSAGTEHPRRWVGTWHQGRSLRGPGCDALQVGGAGCLPGCALSHFSSLFGPALAQSTPSAAVPCPGDPPSGFSPCAGRAISTPSPAPLLQVCTEHLAPLPWEGPARSWHEGSRLLRGRAHTQLEALSLPPL